MRVHWFSMYACYCVENTHHLFAMVCCLYEAGVLQYVKVRISPGMFTDTYTSKQTIECEVYIALRGSTALRVCHTPTPTISTYLMVKPASVMSCFTYLHETRTSHSVYAQSKQHVCLQGRCCRSLEQLTCGPTCRSLWTKSWWLLDWGHLWTLPAL